MDFSDHGSWWTMDGQMDRTVGTLEHNERQHVRYLYGKHERATGAPALPNYVVAQAHFEHTGWCKCAVVRRICVGPICSAPRCFAFWPYHVVTDVNQVRDEIGNKLRTDGFWINRVWLNNTRVNRQCVSDPRRPGEVSDDVQGDGFALVVCPTANGCVVP